MEITFSLANSRLILKSDEKGHDFTGMFLFMSRNQKNTFWYLDICISSKSKEDFNAIRLFLQIRSPEIDLIYGQ